MCIPCPAEENCGSGMQDRRGAEENSTYQDQSGADENSTRTDTRAKHAIQNMPSSRPRGSNNEGRAFHRRSALR